MNISAHCLPKIKDFKKKQTIIPLSNPNLFEISSNIYPTAQHGLSSLCLAAFTYCNIGYHGGDPDLHSKHIHLGLESITGRREMIIQELPDNQRIKMAAQARAGDMETREVAEVPTWPRSTSLGSEETGEEAEVGSWRALEEQRKAVGEDVAPGCIGRAEGCVSGPFTSSYKWWLEVFRSLCSSDSLGLLTISYNVWVQCLQQHGREKMLIEMLWARKQLPVPLVPGCVRKTWDRMTYSKNYISVPLARDLSFSPHQFQLKHHQEVLLNIKMHTHSAVWKNRANKTRHRDLWMQTQTKSSGRGRNLGQLL